MQQAYFPLTSVKMDGVDMRNGGPYHHRRQPDDDFGRDYSNHPPYSSNRYNMHNTTDAYSENASYPNHSGAVGTHTSGAIAGPARHHQHHSERLPTALDRIFALQKVRLTELGFSDNFDLAATAASSDRSKAQDSAYHSTDDTSDAADKAAHDTRADGKSLALDAVAIARRKKKNQQKKLKQKEKKKQNITQQTNIVNLTDKNDDQAASSSMENVEIEYVPEEISFDTEHASTSSIAKEFSRVFTAFQKLSAGRGDDDDTDAENDTNKRDSAPNVKLTKVPVDLHEADDDEVPKKSDNCSDSQQPLSRRRLKKLLRPTVAKLKQQVERPDVVEFHDVTSPDPQLLIFLKAHRSSVPVPRHWCFKRKYLAGKRGIEKPPFELPDFIRKTGITEMREARAEKDDAKTLKQKMREKVRPKMGKIDINYQKLHDAFFRWQTKPRVSMHGDLYYEGKETESKLRDKKPGIISNDLRLALGMPVGPNAQKYPPPWLIAMQRYGPPPSYTELKVPGLNAPIPEGCTFGYHAGGWGKPPVDERGRPLYGDVFGLSGGIAGGAVAAEKDEFESTVTKLWGELQYDDEEEESESEEEADADEEAAGATKKAGEDAELDGTSSTAAGAAAGLVTPMSTGIQSSVLAGGLETPAEIELRKQRIDTEMDAGDDQRPLYTVLPERRVDKLSASAMMGSAHLYDLRAAAAAAANYAAPAASGVGNKPGDVMLAIDPSELEQHGGLPRANDVEKRYQAQMEQQRHQLEKEDFSDMVAEHASRQAQKRRKQQQDTSKTSGAAKKRKDFKF